MGDAREFKKSCSSKVSRRVSCAPEHLQREILCERSYGGGKMANDITVRAPKQLYPVLKDRPAQSPRRLVTFCLDTKSNQKNQDRKKLPPAGKTPWPAFLSCLCPPGLRCFAVAILARFKVTKTEHRDLMNRKKPSP